MRVIRHVHGWWPVFTLLSLLSAAAVYGGVTVGVATSMDKVMIKGGHHQWPFEGAVGDTVDLALARNEHEAFQVVIMPDRDLTGATVKVSHPQGTSGQGPFNGSVNVWLVGHVDVSDNPLGDLNAQHPPHLSDYTGWWPDPLLTFQQVCNIEAGDRVPFWVEVTTRPDTPAGDYAATITVSSDQTQATTLQLKLRVWDFEIPEQSSLPTAFSCHYWQANLVYGRHMRTEEFQEKLWALQQAHRLSPMELYRRAPVPVGWLKTWKGMGANAFNLGLVPLRDPDELAEVYAFVKQNDMLDQSYVYGFDEVPPEKFEEMHQEFSAIRERYPGLRTMTTASDGTFGGSEDTAFLRSVVDIWVPTTPVYDRGEAEALRAEGMEMWWYTAVYPRNPYANFLLRYTAIESRLLLGAMTYKYQAGGFLYYSMLNWADPDRGVKNQPITSGPYTKWDPRSFFHKRQNGWADGDGCLYYAGPPGVWAMPSIRLKNIRDGLEDYEYLHLLAQLVERVQEVESSHSRGFIKEARALLEVPETIVADLVRYTRDSREFYRYRRQIAEAIIRGQQLVRQIPAAALKN